MSPERPDWGMTGLFRGFLAVLLLVPLAALVPAVESMVAPGKRQSAQGVDPVLKPPAAADERTASIAAYEQALREAAVKRPAYMVPLRTLDPAGEDVEVTYFGFTELAPGKQELKKALWVALADQLRAECAGKPQPQRALQQILGLPPLRSKQTLYTLMVSPKDMKRPCMSGAGVDQESCGFKVPEQLDDHLVKVAKHNWEAISTGSRNDRAGPQDYPYRGFPFTGMGWTYNWDPSHPTHVGVTEFVVEVGKEVTVKEAVDLNTFCAAKK